MPLLRFLAVSLSLAIGMAAAPTALAAESYDSCSNFIDSLPATISTQGVWCLRKDLATAVTSGVAVNVAANNVTVDCNDFKIGGLAAGSSSMTIGIYASEKQNVTIRNCGVRGFRRGVVVSAGAGHLIEHNRLDYNLVEGIVLTSYPSNSVIRDNRVYDTGGSPSGGARYGIYVYAGDGLEIHNNVVAGVYGTPGIDNSVIGLYRANYDAGLDRAMSRVTNNAISSLIATGSGIATGIHYTNGGGTSGRLTLTGNHILLNQAQPGSLGVRCVYSDNVIARDNTVTGFATNMDSACYDAGGNVTF